MTGTGADSKVSAFDLIGAALPAAALLLIANGFVTMFAFVGEPIRDRIFFGIEQGIGTFTAFLALSAVALTLHSRQAGSGNPRWNAVTILAAQIVAVVVLAAAVYSVWYVLSLSLKFRVPGTNANGVAISFGERSWSERVTEILGPTSSALLGVVTLIATRWRRSTEPIRSAVTIADA